MRLGVTLISVSMRLINKLHFGSPAMCRSTITGRIKVFLEQIKIFNIFLIGNLFHTFSCIFINEVLI